MNLLLDTHTVLWWAADEPLSDEAFAALSDPENPVYVSAASMWEIVIKEALGKLTILGDFQAAIDEDFDRMPITFEDVQQVALLPRHHRDPFDRLLVAQAQLHDLRLVTRDPAMDAYEVEVLRA